MRHCAGTRLILVVQVLFASGASADEVADRIAIVHSISTLNESPPHVPLFTEEGNGSVEFERLRNANPRLFRIVAPGQDSTMRTDRPSVTISHEPWGEATLNSPSQLPGDSSRNITFVTSDVALAQGFCTFEDNDGIRQTKVLLFVMKKENGWKIASIRVLAPYLVAQPA